ncbi:benomyl methotrexate resistance protein [Diplodia corticola]|uniref:Benomyl methotrexate resistance protein n=1 Tax=Diplodia corticola TaxID=236234 RepID=A0A1J9QJ57_9PEZI|nr:benomyl methotrexate resistance protein [Diplodia corticola]OJD28894.1 benomyl methotrexate resistance protein [Diplodia corticola]
MSDLIRDAPIGQIIRFVTRNRLLQYPEEKPDYKLPGDYTLPPEVPIEEPYVPDIEPVEEEVEPREERESEDQTVDLEKSRTADTSRTGYTTDLEKAETADTGLSRPVTANSVQRVGTRTALQRSITRADLEQQFTNATLERGPTIKIAPTHLDDGTTLVDWYTTDDPDNPQNWSFGKKAFVATQIYAYTLAVYMGSAIYAPSEEGVMREFGVSINAAALGLSMYVLAYGIGPLIWSPLSEIPLIGRNPPYMVTFAVFVILLVPTALVDNFAGLVVLRFLLGFFGSPCLATGGASLQDMYSLIKLPYVLSLWALAATCGPALGPIISGFSVTAKNWRWSQWELLWLAGPVWLVLFLFLPETSPSTILLRRAARLRRLTNNNTTTTTATATRTFKSQSELDQASLTLRAMAAESLWRPIQLILLDPAIAFTAVYTALIYGIFYSFFEAFPQVYTGTYAMNLGQMGLTFLSITAGVILSIAGYWAYVRLAVEPSIRARGLGAPERRLIPALAACACCPAGLFVFGWTAQPRVHWIVSVVGVGIFTVGIFVVLQCIFLYLPLVYPQYAASLFAGNDFLRSTLAAGAVHFSRPLFANLGVGVGVSILAAFTVVCCAGVWLLYFFGERLRARSRFSAK